MLYFAILVLIGLCQVNGGSTQRNTAPAHSPHAGGPRPNSTTINDTDYWDYDDFVPYREDRHDLFDWRLLKQILLSQSENIIISPFSVKLLLGLLLEGAGPESVTQKELSSVTPNIRSPALVKEFYSKALQSLNEPSKNYELHIGTKIFVNEFIEPRQRFAAIAMDSYDTSIDRLQFRSPQNTAHYINRWCSNITNGHIPQLVTPDQIQSAVMVMANAIFFDGVWRKPFAEENSFDFIFYKTPHQEIQTRYMTQLGNFFFFDSTKYNAKIIRLPYKGKKFSMTIILPGAKGGLDELIRELEGDSLKRLQWFMEDVEVKVTLPRFQFDFTSQLEEHLHHLGIHEIFTSNASLPGFARGNGLKGQLKVSSIVQKCGLIVNEKGTKAYGATDVLLANKFGSDTVNEFNANRPFMFMIEDEVKGTIIFTGKVTDPNKH